MIKAARGTAKAARAAPPPAPALPPVIGHRGAAASAPENTLAALRRAAALGCGWVEFDVRLTADGALVLMHDGRLERTTSGHGRVVTRPLAAIQDLDAGAWFAPAFAGERVPTLAEALALLSELGLGANIELKGERGRDRATAAAVAAEFDRIGRPRMPPTLLSSFRPAALAAARDLAADVPRGLLLGAIPRHWQASAAQLGCATIHADHRRLDAATVAAVRAAGYTLLAYTVNEPARARILYEWGITSVFSDAPDIIQTMAAHVHSAVGQRQGADL